MNIKLITEDAQTISAYCAGDENSRRGLVVLQEIFGENSHIRDVCDRYAKEGYYVIAPALFDRVEKNVELAYTGDEVQGGLALRSKVSPEDTLQVNDSVIKYHGYRSVALAVYR